MGMIGVATPMTTRTPPVIMVVPVVSMVPVVPREVGSVSSRSPEPLPPPRTLTPRVRFEPTFREGLPC